MEGALLMTRASVTSQMNMPWVPRSMYWITFRDMTAFTYLRSITKPLSDRVRVSPANLSAVRPDWKPKFSKTEKGASSERMFRFMMPVCSIT